MKTIVAFDLGKVLVDFDYSIAARKIAARCSKPPKNLHAFLGSSPLLQEYERGQLTRQEFFGRVKDAAGFLGDIHEFGKFFADIFWPIEPMIGLHSELRQRGLKTYIFSNTNDLAIEHIRNDFPFFKNFDGFIFSYEVGAMKPEAKIYETLEAITGRRGAEILYIDDRPENVDAGKARGWRTILHESPEKTGAALKNFDFGK